MRCLGGRLTLVAIPAEELAVGESIHVGANGVINAPLLGQLQPVLLDGHLAPGRVADLAPVHGGELEPAGELGAGPSWLQSKEIRRVGHCSGL